MSTYQGESGKVSIKKGGAEEKYLAHITGWSVDSAMEVQSTPYFGGSATEEGFTEATPGTISWSGSIDGAVDFADTSGQDVLFDAHNNAELLEFTFYLDADNAFKGKGYIDSYSPTQSAEGKGEFSATVSGNGKLAKVAV